MLASVTRLQLRSWRFLLPFFFHAGRSQKQAVNAAGCLAVTTRKTRGFAFWTLSVWADEAALRDYLRTGAHREAMPKLFLWCDEAVTTHWPIEQPNLPSWEQAESVLLKQGRLHRVQHPSQGQREGRISIA